MKKIYTLGLLLVLTSTANAQITNGGLEIWDNTTTPNSFTMLSGAAVVTSAVSQESAIKRSGSFSAKHTTAATSSVKIQNETAVLIPGNNYTISYWFLDNDPLARSRPWIYWLDSANATITDATSDNTFRPTTYSSDSPQWLQFSASFTAPAGAVKLRFEMRTYAVGAGLGSVYYDDMSVINNGVLSIQENNISGLKVYPNPISGNVLNIETTLNGTKAIAIFDVLGKQVLNTTIENTTVNIGTLNAGVYVVKVTEEGKTATTKLVVR